MRPHRVVVLDVLTKHPPQMPFVDGDDVIEALAPERPDHPLGDGVGVRRAHRSQNRLDPDPSSACDEVPAIATVAVSDEEPWLMTPGGRLDHLPPDPGRDRVLRDVPDEHVERAEGEGLHREPDVAELLLQRGFEVTHETIRAWEVRFAPLLANQLRAKRRGQAGGSWYLDETYVKVAGRWCYLYRAIDHEGVLLDSMLSEHRDKHAARRFLRRLVEVTERKPQRVTTDQHPPYRRAIRWILGRKVVHRTNPYLNNLTEQDHRAVKQRYYPMLGFGSFASAARFCSVFEELRQYLRARGRRGEVVPLAEQRRRFVGRWHALIAEMAAA